jgi:hypothetical protein
MRQMPSIMKTAPDPSMNAPNHIDSFPVSGAAICEMSPYAMLVATAIAALIAFEIGTGLNSASTRFCVSMSSDEIALQFFMW